MRAANPVIKMLYLGSWLGIFAAAIVFGVGGVIVGEAVGDRDIPEIAQVIYMVIAVPLVLLWLGTALWWVHDAWASVPPEYREAPLVGKVEPALAVLFFFIPCFNLVWMFLCNLGLAESINRAAAATGTSERASTPLGVIACCVQMLPYCNILFSPILWFAFMYTADKARADLGRVDAQKIASTF